MKKYDKLVRDRIPEIIESDGHLCYYHVADDKEFKVKLHEKLQEEIAEFLENPCAEEMADILEVLDAVRMFYDIDLDHIKNNKTAKKLTNGKFNERYILESTQKI